MPRTIRKCYLYILTFVQVLKANAFSVLGHEQPSTDINTLNMLLQRCTGITTVCGGLQLTQAQVVHTKTVLYCTV